MKIEPSTAFMRYTRWIETGGHYSDHVLEVIVHSMQKDAGNTKQSGKGRFRPSLIGNPCDRIQLLSYLSDEGSDFKGNWRTWMGTWMHLAFQTFLLDEYGEHLRIEHAVVPDRGRVGVHGKADWYWYGGNVAIGMSEVMGPHIGDYKSAMKIDAYHDAPKDKHVQQLLYEMVTLDVRRAYLVYQTRSFGAMAVWHLEAEDEDIRRATERLSVLQGYADSGELPDLLLPCRSMSGPYKECDWARQCFDRL